jgi:rRNA maturation RNase YbeY
MASFSKVCFFFENKDFSLKQRTILKRFIESIFSKEKKKLESLNYVFVADKRLLEINRQFLQHDYYTDIITFNLSGNASIHAEVYISIDRVRENAKKLDVSFKSELHRVIFHGALHLCGYNDKSKREIEKMREKEDFYLYQYFIQSST